MIVQVPEDSSNTEGVGARLKRLRLQRGLSQRDLSSPGVSYAYISRIEAGARTPSVKALRKLSQKLGVSVEYLETGRDIREVDDRELKLSEAELQLRLESDTGAAEKLLEEVLAEASSAGDRTVAIISTPSSAWRRRSSTNASRLSSVPTSTRSSAAPMRRWARPIGQRAFSSNASQRSPRQRPKTSRSRSGMRPT
jgi:transcriptional regulator with XRE-family HTH domain